MAGSLRDFKRAVNALTSLTVIEWGLEDMEIQTGRNLLPATSACESWIGEFTK